MSQDQSEVQSSGGAGCRSYLLRLWQEVPGGEERALLQDVLGGEPRCFSSLESLFAYLETARGQLEGGEDAAPVRAAGRDDSQIGEESRQPLSRKTGRATWTHPVATTRTAGTGKEPYHQKAAYYKIATRFLIVFLPSLCPFVV